MDVKPLRNNIIRYIKKRNIFKKTLKQIELISINPRHPSLHTERLEPKHLKLYSFRINKKFRAIFIFISKVEIEIIDINDHYQ